MVEMPLTHAVMVVMPLTPGVMIVMPLTPAVRPNKMYCLFPITCRKKIG